MLVEKQAMLLQEEDAADIASIVADVSPAVEEFPPDSPQRIFWEQQKQYSQLKYKRQMRWHPLVIRFALNLKYLSSSAYRAMHRSGVISLPSECTLSDYTHWASPHSGVQLEFVEEFCSLVTKDTSPGQHHCALSMDEMKLKSGLVFDKNAGTLCGFVDLGNVNRDIERAVSGEKEETPTEKMAEQVYVFLVRSVFKPLLSVPVAHYFSSSLKGKAYNNYVSDISELPFLFTYTQERRYFPKHGKLLRHWKCSRSQWYH